MNKKNSIPVKNNFNILKRISWNFLNYIAWFAPWKRIRVFFHKLKGIKIGNNVEIGYFVILDNRRPELITIEDNVTITSRCNILTHDLSRRHIDGVEIVGKVKICNGAFLGISSTILPGVTIGDKCIIGSGSVVSKNTEANSVYVGIPAKKIKEIKVKTG